mgnify:CR=1 FL=1
MKNNFLKMIYATAVLSASLLSNAANAALITTIDAGATSHIFSSNSYNSNGPVSENGFTWTATNSGYYGYDSVWGLNGNGSWNNMNLLGLNNTTGSMTITFDVLVRDVLAFVSYAAGVGYPKASISIFDVNNVLLESFDLTGKFSNSAVNAGWNYGFSRSTAEIKSIKFTNSYIVASNLRSFVDVSTPSPNVPEPSTLAIFALGMAGLVSRRLSKKA